MEENLVQAAIKEALLCNWSEAIKLNLKILKAEPENVEALNRLSRAYFESGNVDKAKATSKKVLKIEPKNNIAKNSLERYSQSKGSKNQSRKSSYATFIEEPGKTKLTMLLNLGSEKVCSCLSSGDEVMLSTHTHKVSVVTFSNKYVGRLADDLAARIRVLIKEGNKFQVVIKSVNKNQVKVFIKSDKRSFPLDSSESGSELSA